MPYNEYAKTGKQLEYIRINIDVSDDIVYIETAAAFRFYFQNRKKCDIIEKWNAISHGVRIVACQMSMDIMGIRQEELIDGVELGGVATFLGSAETSDTSLFI